VWALWDQDMVFGLGCKYLMLIGELSPDWLPGCQLDPAAPGNPGLLVSRRKKRGELFAPLPALEGN